MKITRDEAFRVLEVTPDAADADIKKSFKRLALQYHPDKNGGCEDSAEKFKLVSAAYARLTSDHDEMDDFSAAFSEDVMQDIFGDSGMLFFMEQLFSGMSMGHTRMVSRKGPRIRIQRPAGTGAAASTGSSGIRGRPRGFPLNQGLPPELMKSLFRFQESDDDEDSSEWETDDEAGAAEGSGKQQGADQESSESEWETDDGEGEQEEPCADQEPCNAGEGGQKRAAAAADAPAAYAMSSQS